MFQQYSLFINIFVLLMQYIQQQTIIEDIFLTDV